MLFSFILSNIVQFPFSQQGKGKYTTTCTPPSHTNRIYIMISPIYLHSLISLYLCQRKISMLHYVTFFARSWWYDTPKGA